MDLKNFKELTNDELSTIEGGSITSAAGYVIGKAIGSTFKPENIFNLKIVGSYLPSGSFK